MPLQRRYLLAIGLVHKSPEELLSCSRKMVEFKKNTTGGAGIE